MYVIRNILLTSTPKPHNYLQKKPGRVDGVLSQYDKPAILFQRHLIHVSEYKVPVRIFA